MHMLTDTATWNQIRKQLKDARRVLETPVYRAAKAVVGWFVKF